jgi:ankyrin repeat protein
MNYTKPIVTRESYIRLDSEIVAPDLLRNYFAVATKLLLTPPPEVPEALLKAAADQALSIAASYCNPELIKVSLKAGANVNLQNNEGRTALMLAAMKCTTDSSGPETIKVLLEAGADVNAKDNYGGTALMGSDSDCKEVLLNAGIDIKTSTYEEAVCELIPYGCYLMQACLGAINQLLGFESICGGNPETILSSL